MKFKIQDLALKCISTWMLIFTCYSVNALTENDCIESGGDYVCEKLSVTDWFYAGPCYSARLGIPDKAENKIMCEAMGFGPVNTCPHDKTSENNLAQIAINYTNIWRNTDDARLVSDTGWLFPSTGTIACWGGDTPAYENKLDDSGKLLIDRREFFLEHGEQGQPEKFIAQRSRELRCPSGALHVNSLGGFCITKKDFGTCGVGNPIQPLNGRKTEAQTDLSYRGFLFNRIYHSRQKAIPYKYNGKVSSGGQWGEYWRTGFDYQLVIQNDTSIPYVILFPEGGLQYFDAGFKHVAGLSNGGVLTARGLEYTYEFNGKKLLFSSVGRLLEITYSNGRRLVFEYSGDDPEKSYLAVDVSGVPGDVAIEDGLLVRAQDGFGQEIFSVSYDLSSKIVFVASPAADAKYKYTEYPPNLVEAVYSNNTSKKYIYSNANFPHALTAIENELGNTYVTWDYDSSGQTISSENTAATGLNKVTLEFENDALEVGAYVSVTNSLGRKTKYFFDQLKGSRRVTKIEGEQSPSGACAAANQYKSYYPNATIQTQTDWEGNVTHFERDALGRTTKKTEGQKWPGQPQYGVNVDASALQTTVNTKITQTCWHPTHNKPERVIEPSRVVIYEYFDNGQLKSKKVEARSSQNSTCVGS